MSTILTPDQRVRVFVSSTLEELADERAAAKRAIEALHLTPVLFELGARPHPPQELYRAYLEQSHVFVAIYWERYGWVAPDMDISGLEDELRLAGDRPRLVYLKRPAPNREPRLDEMLERVRDSGVSYKAFESAAELEGLLAHDLSSLMSERFQSQEPAQAETTRPVAPPVASTSFVGRGVEVDEVLDRLRHHDARLVTLVGPGGIGKTRIAIEVAGRFGAGSPAGVVYVSLETVSDAAYVDEAILRALDIRERGGRSASDVLRTRLADQRLLLVLDNFEHLVEGAGQVADLLAATTGVKVLVTSREPLRLRGEHEVLISSLAPPDAERLFLDRSRAGPGHQADGEQLAAVRAICERLDGVPLAIELAAARTRLLAPTAILERLGRRLDFLVAGPRDLPARQQALRSTIAWSYELLDEEQQRAFAALGTFAGSFTEAAAREVTGLVEALDVLASLVDKSLLQVETPGGDLRLRMLGIVRDFALERLEERAQLEATRARHAEHFRAVAVEALGPLRTADQSRSLDRLELDAANLRASLDFWIERRDWAVLAEVAWSLWVYAWLRGYLHEIRSLLRQVLEEPDVGPRERTRLQGVVGILDVYGGGPGDEAVALLTEVVARARAEGIEDVLAPATMQLAIAGGEGDLDEAVALFTKLGDDWGAAAALCAKAWVHVTFESYAGADDVFDAALAAAHRIDDDLVMGMILVNVAEREIHRGDDRRAEELLRDAVRHYRRLRAAYPASYSMEATAHLMVEVGQPESALRLLLAAEGLRASIEVPIWTPAEERHDGLVAALRAELAPEAQAAAARAVEGLDYEATLDLVIDALDLVPGAQEGPP